MSLASHAPFPSGGRLGRRRPRNAGRLVFSSAFAIAFAALLVGLAAFSMQRMGNATSANASLRKPDAPWRVIVERRTTPVLSGEGGPPKEASASPPQVDFSHLIPSPTAAQLAAAEPGAEEGVAAPGRSGPLAASPLSEPPSQATSALAPPSPPGSAAPAVAALPAAEAPSSGPNPPPGMNAGSPFGAEQASLSEPPDPAAPPDSAAAETSAPPRAMSSGGPSRAGAGTGARYSIYLGAPASESAARAQLRADERQYGSLLHGHRLTFRGMRTGGRLLYRVRVSRLASAEADALCARLKASGTCDIVRE